jgi:hypothetical protein
MLNGNLMIGANDGSFEQAPNIFESVSVNDSAHVLFLKVIDRSVKRVVSGQRSEISQKLYAATRN